MSHKSTILIVDDEPIGRQLIDAILYKEGYNLEFAENGREAFEKAKSTNPDLILMDVMMPEIDGFEVCQMLREDDSMASVPIILVTALDDIDSRIRGLEAGADDYISKPFDRLELLARIKIITRLNKYRKGSSGSEGESGAGALPNDQVVGLYNSMSHFLNKQSINIPGMRFSQEMVFKGSGLATTIGTNNLAGKNVFFTISGGASAIGSLFSLYLIGIARGESQDDTGAYFLSALNALEQPKVEEGTSTSFSYLNFDDGKVGYVGINSVLFLIDGNGVENIKGLAFKYGDKIESLSIRDLTIEQGTKLIVISSDFSFDNSMLDKVNGIITDNTTKDIDEILKAISEQLDQNKDLEKQTGEIALSGFVTA